MKRTYFHLFCLLVVSLSFSVLCPQKSHAALTKQLSYQGRLQDASGQPVANGTYSIVFSIYNVSTGGAALWTETQNVSVDKGGFSAYLGSVNPLTLPFNEDYFLGITVGSDPEMTPRLKLAIVGTSAFAFEAGKLEGKAASDFALSTHNHDSNYSPTTHTHTITVGTSEITDGSITASDIDATAVQKRVTGSCAGQVLVAINQDGTVTCEADDTGGGSSLTPASTVQPVTSASVVGTSTNYAREDHQHNLVSNFITDSMVSTSAGIATSKLSGAVTSISGHGLGSLATMNAVSGAEIQDGTILFADIASNSCASGQVIEYNGTAWICGTDDVGGGGGIITNPTSTQTITAGNSTTSPLVLKAASAPIQDIFDVQNNVGSSFIKVNSTGNVLVGNPAQMTPKLSVEDTSINPGIAVQQKGTGAALDVWQSGTSGSAGVFSITNAGNTSDLISGDLSGTGNLLKLSLSGVNKFVVDKVGNVTATSFSGSGSSLTGVSASDPNAIKNNPSAAQTIQPTADVVPLIIKDDAGATADLFDVQNNAGTTLVKVNPSGNLLVGNPGDPNHKISVVQVTTVGSAAKFYINQVSNANAILLGDTTGTGNLLQLQQGGVNKFVVNNAGNVLVGNPGTVAKVSGLETGTVNAAGRFEVNNAASTWGALYATTNSNTDAFTAQNTGTGVNGSAARFIIIGAGQTAPLITGRQDGTGDFIKIQTNAGTVTKFQVTNEGNTLIGNPAFTTAKVSAEETGTANNAGYFKISNAGNTNDAVYGYTSGTGAAVFGYGAGSGNAVYGYVSSTGKAGFFDIQNAVNAASVIVGNTTGTGNLLQLQQSYTNKFVVSNTGSILLDGNANPSIKASGATPNLILDADGTGASTVTVKNTTSPGSLTLQVNGNISAFSGSNSVPVTGATQQLILTGNTCEGVAGAQSITLSFAPAFAATPKVVATGTTATAGAGFISSITGASTSGATVNMGGTQTGTVECVDWIAIGNK